MIICGCAMEAQYQLKLLEQREHKPIYIKDRIGKYFRRTDKQKTKNGGHVPCYSISPAECSQESD